MRQKPTADLEPIDLVQILVGPDRPELQDLVKSRVGPSGLGIIENKGHHDPWAMSCNNERDFLSTKAKDHPSPHQAYLL
jgi:hypothetical protein